MGRGLAALRDNSDLRLEVDDRGLDNVIFGKGRPGKIPMSPDPIEML